MNTERVRGHRQGIRAVKGKENRTHKTVAHKNTVKTMMNKTAKQHTHSTGIQNRSQTAISERGKQDTQRGRAHVHGHEVTTMKKHKAPSYAEYMKTRQVRADTPARQGQARMTVGPVVDTAANLSIVTARDKKYLQNVRPLGRAERVQSATGCQAIRKSWKL